MTYNLQLHITTKKIYDSQIGIREQGVNSGPQVEDYLRYVNLRSGQPWCVAFICWVYGQAGVENPRSGWSPDLFKGSKVIWDRVESREKHKDRNSLVAMSVRPATNNQQPTTADIFGLFFPEKNRIAHAGFVDQWDGTWLITVEGNTNVSGGREGDGVYRKRRLVKSVYQVARYIGVPYN
ncbi:MAG: CHAP domain-containing protein [Pedobacter sp.]|nr:CHAP domain-containing protein [Pedobacter sp.]